MTEKYFFDTDCLSAFLWVREESILAKLYAGKIILPAQVYNELKKVPLTTGDILVEALDAGFITETEGNTIWAEMIRKKRRLPTATFSEYLTRHKSSHTM